MNRFCSVIALGSARLRLVSVLVVLAVSSAGCGHSPAAGPGSGSGSSGAKTSDQEAVRPKPQMAPSSATVTGDVVTLAADAPELSKIRVETVKLEPVAVDEVLAPGNVETNPNRVAHALLPVPGRITSVAVKLGDPVREGDPLVTVESPEVDAAELAYRQAEAALSQVRAAEIKAQADADRLADLFEHQAVAQKEVLAARNTLVQVKAGVQQAEAGRLQTLRRLELLGLKPGSFGQRVTVRAPLAGKILAISVVSGEYRNDLTAPLLTIADLRNLWVSSNVPESYIRHCRVGGPVLIELVAFPGETFRGRVSHIADTVDPDTRTIKVRAELDNASGRFRPEMYGRIRYGEASQPLPVVDDNAVVQMEGKNVVFVEQSRGRFVRRAVTVGKRIDERLAIEKGLAAGERVVVAGTIYLKGGL